MEYQHCQSCKLSENVLPFPFSQNYKKVCSERRLIVLGFRTKEQNKRDREIPRTMIIRTDKRGALRKTIA